MRNIWTATAQPLRLIRSNNIEEEMPEILTDDVLKGNWTKIGESHNLLDPRFGSVLFVWDIIRLVRHTKVHNMYVSRDFIKSLPSAGEQEHSH